MQEEHMVIPSSSDGLLLYATLMAPQKPRALVQIVHGMQEHKERYFDFMRELARSGFASVISDLRGHGQSVHDRCDLGHLYQHGDVYAIQDVEDVRIAALRQLGADDVDTPQLPYFIFAHSMGTLIARNYLQEHARLLQGMVLSGAPGNNPATQVGLFLVRVLTRFKGDRATSPFCAMLLTASNTKGLEGTHPLRWLSKNEENVAAYEQDPGCGFPFTLSGYHTLLTLLQNTFDASRFHVQNKKLPILFIAGENDPVILGKDGFFESQQFLREVGYTNVSAQLYPELRHELLQEIEAPAITEDIIAFFKTCV